MIIRVFDFDGTLVHSPLPTDENKALWAKAYNRDYPHKGWWSKRESLDPVFNVQPVTEVVEHYNKAVSDGEHIMLLTSRMFTLKHEIISLLNGLSLTKFDHYIFGPHGNLDKGEVLESYCRVLTDSGERLQEVHVYDDMEHELEAYGRMRGRMGDTGIGIRINRVTQGGGLIPV